MLHANSSKVVFSPRQCPRDATVIKLKKQVAVRVTAARRFTVVAEVAQITILDQRKTQYVGPELLSCCDAQTKHDNFCALKPGI